VKSGFGDKPVNFVSFWDAARFTNYLTTGDTESGVYVLTPTGISNNTITRNETAWNAGGVAVVSDDEWYKAAYYKGGSTNAGYWDYAHQSDTIGTADANYADSVGTVADVGTYSDSVSYYGTYDQNGNVVEQTDTWAGANRFLRGGAFISTVDILESSYRNYGVPTHESTYLGFRVSSLGTIPEPSSYAAMFGCLALTVAIIRRKGRRTL
jgi:hypothetical protein